MNLGVSLTITSIDEAGSEPPFSGLDARYMISCLQPPNIEVLSLTTIASPHRGSAFADYVFDRIGRMSSLNMSYSIILNYFQLAYCLNFTLPFAHSRLRLPLSVS